MSAYREKPPPPKWRIVYRTPIAQRLGQMTVVAGALAAGSLVAIGIGALLGNLLGGLLLVTFGLMIFLTACVLLVIGWMTHASLLAERTVVEILPDPRDPAHCRVATAGGHWRLPLPAGALKEGQTLRVRYREVSPDEDQETRREILEVRVIEE